MLKKISVKRLTVGVHVSLKDVPWFKHPFLFSKFTISSSSQIKEILALGIEEIFYDPEKSKAQPLMEDADITVEISDQNFASKSMLKSKKASELRKRRKRFQEVEQSFTAALGQSDSIMRDIRNGHIDFYTDAQKIVNEMVDAFTQEVSYSVQHINLTASDDGQQYHALNVMSLSLMLGRELGLSRDEMEKLSAGALMHDIGQFYLSKKLRIKSKMTKSELQEFHEHPRYGVSILSKLPDIDKDVMKIVYQHHENCLGTGYPKKLTGDQINRYAKIVAIADTYDRIINTRDPSLALSPHKALAFMFGKNKGAYDENYLSIFIKMLGVYPPGTVCRFSTGDIGVVIGVDPSDVLHPEVVIYDPAIPKYDAIIYKLGHDLDLEITGAIPPKDFEMEIMNYLDSRTGIQYFPSPK